MESVLDDTRFENTYVISVLLKAQGGIPKKPHFINVFMLLNT